MIRRAACVVVVLATQACSSETPHPAPDRLAALRTFEAERTAATDFARVPPSSRAFGADPYALAPIPNGDAPPRRLAGVLRGADAVVLLDAATLTELARASTPPSPAALAVTRAGEIRVVAEGASSVSVFAAKDAALEPRPALPLPHVLGARGVDVAPDGVTYVVEERQDRLIVLDARGAVLQDEPIARGPTEVRRIADRLVVLAPVDHTIVVRAVDRSGVARADGEVRIRHDGPMWGFDAAPDGDALLVAAAGIEDHPLDRTGGSFGFVDSFLFVYRVEGGVATRIAAVNLSERGVVTPKAVLLDRGATGFTVTCSGYATPGLVRLRFEGAGEPAMDRIEAPPGTRAPVRLGGDRIALADPLLDAWVAAGAAPLEVRVATPGDDRTALARVGEALFFTSIMAPWNRTEGALSRFTCEACHLEGAVDGRTHHTGRGDVHATTKPLVGLFGNRPYFSRALDPDLATMIDNEFRVANANSGHDPWFSIGPADAPWLTSLGVEAPLEPAHLRRALMEHFMRFSHRPNPAAQKPAFDASERRGAEIFRDRCASCHEPRLAADDPRSAMPYDGWERLILSPAGSIVWARATYEKTGVEPYVHERGARVPSLRRLYVKRPYFTNGSAPALRDVLRRARFGAGAFLHSGESPSAPERLGDGEVEALGAFLDLL